MLIHIIVPCYRYLKLSLRVHYYFKIMVAIRPATRFYYLMLKKRHIFTILQIYMCGGFFFFLVILTPIFQYSWILLQSSAYLRHLEKLSR